MIGVIAVRSMNGEWIAWPSWFVWRWGQRYPTDIGFRDNADVWHRETA